ncbi:hypothetical protein NM208_g4249 [Fusarium decemcellulare]|uniref:Uncharacterized protein n=1 Tax=Fusarium decemcellulare TaxID=57161 RepID=A0ACC1SLC2_9HYPO|nr:hypothetical protein NM208_g4249 [Fusarium decemcellulare]
MAEVALAALAFIPPFLHFTAVIGKTVDEFIATKEFVENNRTLKRLERQIRLWTSMLKDISSLQGPKGSARSQTVRACKASIRQMANVNRTLENLQESLWGDHNVLHRTESRGFDDFSSGDDQAVDTANTSFQDEVSEDTTASTMATCDGLREVFDPPSPTYQQSDQSTMTDIAGMSPPLTSVLYPNFQRLAPLGRGITRDATDIGEDGHLQVAGSFEQTALTSSTVLKIDKEDWESSYHLGLGNSSVNGMVTLNIDLPASRLKELQPTCGDHLEVNLEADAITRQFSLILSPVKLMNSQARSRGFPVGQASTLHARSTELILHWDIQETRTKAQVYYRLSKLKELRQEIEGRRGRNATFPVPKFCNIAVCILMDWERYQKWIQGDEDDTALQALWEQGIIATLPLLIRLKDGTFRPHVWCETRTRLGEVRGADQNEKAIHAIVQKYTYPECGFAKEKLEATGATTRFITVIHRVGSQDEWVDFIRSVESVEPDAGVPLYRLGSNGDSIDAEKLSRHCGSNVSLWEN